MNRGKAARVRDLMPRWDRLRYLAWRAGLGGDALGVRLADGRRLVMRRPPAGDMSAAMEIFVLEPYRSPRPLAADAVRTISDLGANVGYSVLYLGRLFPRAHIDAYEPHPAHVELLRKHVALNGLEGRVAVHPVAVSNRARRMFLTDAAMESSLVDDGGGAGRIPVGVQDWLRAAGGRRIDLLKMDIEGAEYDILFDPRFDRLDVGTIVLEWHQPAGSDRGEADVIRRLEGLGFQVEPGFGHDAPHVRSGVVWGYRG